MFGVVWEVSVGCCGAGTGWKTRRVLEGELLDTY